MSVREKCRPAVGYALNEEKKRWTSFLELKVELKVEFKVSENKETHFVRLIFIYLHKKKIPTLLNTLELCLQTAAKI